MRIPQILATGRPSFSFEYFPPKTPEGELSLFETVERLRELRPSFVSVTYGAGGSTREKTLAIVKRIQRETGLTAMAHLTCVGHSRPELAEILRQIEQAGIENVLALRGDPPQGEKKFVPAPDGFRHASELARFIKAQTRLAVGGACYPETHQEAQSPAADIAHLKEKVEAGVEFLISQLFYDNERFRDFLPRARTAGIEVPIIPGIMPITNVAQIQRITSLCGARIPQVLASRLEEVKDDAAASLELGVRYAVQQCRELLDEGAPGIHFYTLNKSDATRRILRALYEEGYGE